MSLWNSRSKSALLPESHCCRQYQQQPTRRFGHRRIRDGPAAGSLAEVDAPDGEVVVVDRAVAITVCGEARPSLAERVAPNGVIGCVDDTIEVVIAWEGDVQEN